MRLACPSALPPGARACQLEDTAWGAFCILLLGRECTVEAERCIEQQSKTSVPVHARSVGHARHPGRPLLGFRTGAVRMVAHIVARLVVRARVSHKST